MNLKKILGLSAATLDTAMAVTVAATIYMGAACLTGPARAPESERPGAGVAAQAPAGGDGSPETPRVYLDTTYAAPSGKTIEVKAGGDFQAALDRAKPGDVISLEAGATFTGNFTLPNKPFNKDPGKAPGKAPDKTPNNAPNKAPDKAMDGDQWIVIRSSADDKKLPPPGTRVTPAYAAAMPKLISPSSDPAIATAKGAHHYRFIGIEIGVAPRVKLIYNIVDFEGGQTSLSQVPHDMVIDRCYIHGDPSNNARRGVALNSASTAVIDSHISDIHEVGADSQALCGWNGPGPFKITNNYLEGAGENVMFGGADPSIQNLIPSDIEFRGNFVAKPLKWKVGHPSYAGIHWTIKNLFELKNAQRVLIDSNVFEYNWTDGQTGTAIVFTPRNQDGGAPWSATQDVTFINNIVRHSGSGFNIAGRDDGAGTSEPSRRILIRNNLLEDISRSAWGGDGELFQIVGGAENITIDHNTGFADGNIITAEADKVPNKKLVFTNNIVKHNEYGVIGTGTGVGMETLKRHFSSYVFQKNVIVGGQASSYPADNYFIKSVSEVGFTNMAKGDYRLSSSSPYRNAGAGGKDIGRNMTSNDTHK